MVERIQRRRASGWRMPENAVYVGRPTRWGNPFDLRAGGHCWTAVAHGFRGDRLGRAAASVAIYLAWILKEQPVEISGCGLYAATPGGDKPVAVGPTITARKPPSCEEITSALRGKDLACWCKPGEPCHADVLLELANRDG